MQITYYKAFYKNIDLISKKFDKRYVFSPLIVKLARDGDLHKSS